MSAPSPSPPPLHIYLQPCLFLFFLKQPNLNSSNYLHSFHEIEPTAHSLTHTTESHAKCQDEPSSPSLAPCVPRPSDLVSPPRVHRHPNSSDRRPHNHHSAGRITRRSSTTIQIHEMSARWIRLLAMSEPVSKFYHQSPEARSFRGRASGLRPYPVYNSRSISNVPCSIQVSSEPQLVAMS